MTKHIGKKVKHNATGKDWNPETGWNSFPDVRVVTLMAMANGYAMVRRRGAMPYVCKVKELEPI